MFSVIHGILHYKVRFRNEPYNAGFHELFICIFRLSLTALWLLYLSL